MRETATGPGSVGAKNSVRPGFG